MRICIATGIMPPQLGGPAQYTVELQRALTELGHEVRITAFTRFKHLPPGVRHLAFAAASARMVSWAELVIVLDTFSTAVPIMALSRIFGKRATIIRTGGDFLWEAFLERTRSKVLLRDFYRTALHALTWKEKLIFHLIGWAMRSAGRVAFSTEWQRDLFLSPYQLQEQRAVIIENHYGGKLSELPPRGKVFLGASRPIVFKNLDTLQQAFSIAKEKIPDIELDFSISSHGELQQRISNAYAVIVVSLGEISPNFVLEALRFNRPVVLTRENGIGMRIGEAAIYVDPLNAEEIAAAMIKLCELEVYTQQRERVRSFNYTRSWTTIAEEFIALAKLL